MDAETRSLERDQSPERRALPDPHVTRDNERAISLEWWVGERKLTLYLGPDEKGREWCLRADSGGVDDSAPCPAALIAHFRWLLGEDE